jgi:hypothetical protein
VTPVSKVAERYVLIDRATKLKFELIFVLPRFLTVNDPKLKEQFVDVMNSKAPSWRIECVSFKCEYKRGEANAYLYTIDAELDIWPRVEKPTALVIALYDFDVPPSIFFVPETSIMAKAVEDTFMSPPHTVVWTNVSIAELVPPSPPSPPSPPNPPSPPSPVVETVVLKEDSLVKFVIKDGKRPRELTEKEIQEKKKDIEEDFNKRMQENVDGWKAEIRDISFTLEGKEGSYYLYSGTIDVAFIKTYPEAPDLLLQSGGISGWFGAIIALATVIALIFFAKEIRLIIKEIIPLIPHPPTPEPPKPVPSNVPIVLEESSLVAFLLSDGRRTSELTKKEVQEKVGDVERLLNEEIAKIFQGWRAEVRSLNFALDRKEEGYFVYVGTIEIAFIKTDPKARNLSIQTKDSNDSNTVRAIIQRIISSLFFTNNVNVVTTTPRPLSKTDTGMTWTILLIIGILIAVGIFLSGLGRILGKQ